MKQTKSERKNPYASLAGGKITAPHTEKEPPRATGVTGSDLRVKK